jgi:hypothetical protein
LTSIRTTLPRVAALIRLCEARLLELFGVRAARIYAFGVALSFAVLMLLAGSSDRRQALHGLFFDALSTLSWVVGGMVGLSAARDLRARDADDGISSLVRQRGHGERELEQARFLAATLRVARLVAVPGVVIALVAALRIRTLASLPWCAYLCAAPIVYALLLGAGVSLLARGSAMLLPSHGRALFALLAIVPELLRQSFSDMPSVPAFYGFVLRQLADWGARLP